MFGRRNFIANFIRQKKYTRANDAQFVSDNHDHLIAFAKNVDKASFNGLGRGEKQNRAYKNPDGDPRGPWKATPLHAKSGNPSNQCEYRFANGVVWKPPMGTYHRFSRDSSLLSAGAVPFWLRQRADACRKGWFR